MNNPRPVTNSLVYVITVTNEGEFRGDVILKITFISLFCINIILMVDFTFNVRKLHVVVSVLT